MARRRFNFEGNDQAYILLLEKKVIELHKSLQLHIQTCSCQQVISSRGIHPETLIPRSSNPTLGREAGNREISDRETSDCETSDRETSDRETSDHETSDRETSDLNTLEIIREDPSKQPIKKCGSKARDYCQSKLEQFLDRIPSLENSKFDDGLVGMRCRSVLGIPDCGQGSIHEPMAVSSEDSGANFLVSIMKQFRDLTLNTSKKGDYHRLVACFQELVFMSLCAVASSNEKDTASIYDVMRQYKKSNATEKHLNKLMRGAKWANRMMFALAKTNWGRQCSNIFFVGKYNCSNLPVI